MVFNIPIRVHVQSHFANGSPQEESLHGDYANCAHDYVLSPLSTTTLRQLISRGPNRTGGEHYMWYNECTLVGAAIVQTMLRGRLVYKLGKSLLFYYYF